MKAIDEQHMLKYLRNIASNTERIAKALEARNNPRRIVEGALKSEPENKDPALDALNEEVAKAILEVDE